MEPISVGFIASAFIAGIITFLAPCTLPLVPAYLGFISGVDQESLKDPSRKDEIRRRVVVNGLFFIIGFTVIFVLFGALAGLAGQELAPYRIWLSRIGGIFVILFGLLMLGVLELPFLGREYKIKLPKWIEVGKPSSSSLIGAVFGLGWTPCVGPVLGSILLLASSSATVFTGAILLLVFSAGLSIPFMVVAIGFAHASERITAMQKWLKWISIVGGLFLIGLGILLLTNNFSLLISWGFQIFGFLEYESLLNLL
ncbi:cytochrome C biogenesis protein [bacterium]|nr:cytochrome C biogenesis protein [bacterium]|tara:strand:+ start:8620 stop:9384 length:765 start_codon:yes stop_codon:yes gene_type:complete